MSKSKQEESEKPLIDVRALWGRILPWVIMLIMSAVGKGAYDVYAFTSTKTALTSSIAQNKEDIKISRGHVEKNSKKLDKILTILCVMNKNKPLDCTGD